MSTKHVLLVEDNSDASRLACEYLRAIEGVTVLVVQRLSLASAELRKRKWDIVLLDLNLPDAKGYDAVTQIRALDPAVSIIVLTASDFAQVAVDVLKLGADDFVSKARLSTEQLTRSFRYIEEKQKSKAALERVEQQQAAIVAMSQYALKVRGLSLLLDYALAQIQQLLQVGPCRILRHSRETGRFIIEAAAGWTSPIPQEFSFPASVATVTGFSLAAGEPVIVGNYTQEKRFGRDEMLVESGVKSSVVAVANGVTEPYGILSVHSFEAREFTRQEAQFIQTIANIVGSAAERIKMEQAIGVEYNKFRSLFNNAVDGIVITDVAQNCVDANPAACKILGTERSEMLKKSFDHFSESQSQIQSHSPQRIIEVVRAPGDRRVLEYTATANFVPGLNLSILRDVTERARLAQERDTFFAVSLDMVCTASIDGYFKRVSPACEAILGFTPDELCASPMIEFIHPNDVSATIDELGKLAMGHNVDAFENRYRCKDGSYKTLSWKSTQVGGVVYATARDMTERNQLRDTLLHNDRMATIGTLAAGVAHEINNPLAYTLSNLSLAADQLQRMAKTFGIPELESIADLVAEAEIGSNRVRDIVRSLKLFSRNDGEKNSSVALLPALTTALKMAMHEIEPRAELVTNFGDMPLVRANEARLSQVFLNILVNAAHALSDNSSAGQRITVSTGTDESGNAVVEITDNGAGIPQESLNRIFEPFFTTKAVGIGTGLGLSICHGIITAIGGKIEVDTELGKGSSFRVVLPPDLTSGTTLLPVRAKEAAVEVRKLKVLIIDDQEALASVLNKILERDFSSEICSDSEKALECIRNRPDFDLILCDLMMPGLTGMDIYERLASEGRGLEQRLIFMTGGAFTPRAVEFLQKVPNPRLEKPFSRKDLKAVVESLHSQKAAAR